MVVKPSINFLTASSDALLVTGAQTIVNSLTSNPDYPTPTPTLATVTTALNAFTVAIADAATGGKEQTAIKIAKRLKRCQKPTASKSSTSQTSTVSDGN